MKRFLTILTLAPIALFNQGCSTTNITKLTTALAKDPAIVVVKVSSVYGVVNFTRIGSNTNSVTITPDGVVTVGAQK